MADGDVDTGHIIEHVFLPPKLPQTEDPSSEKVLIDTSLDGLNSLCDLILPDSIPPALVNALALLGRLKKINSLEDGKTDERALREILLSLAVGQTLALRISAQNAGVIISRQDSTLTFEAFELSATNESVVNTKGRLKREFPGVAVSLDAGLLEQEDFAEMISQTLSRMCHEKAPGMQPTTRKAGALHEEGRDTASPAAVTELLFGFLRGLEASTTAAVTSITKNTRDEVLWNDAKAPWRRSPSWLLIRVALQLVISRSPGGSRDMYKETMLYIMSHILQVAPPQSSDALFVMSSKIARRLRKISDVSSCLPASVRESVEHILRTTSSTLSARWTAIQKQDQRDLKLPELATLDFEEDTIVSLPALDEHIDALESRRSPESPSRFVPGSELLCARPNELPSLPSANSDDSYFACANLHQFEQWISQSLDSWLSTQNDATSIAALHRILEQYHRLATTLYSENAEMQSVKILTLYELWIACDKVALKECSLLADFHPDIPGSVLENLLLPFRCQTTRLSNVEQYLRWRATKSIEPATRLFSTARGGFANRFFEQSKEQQALLASIEQDAETSRQEKLREYRQVTAKYQRLQSLFDQVECEYETRVVDDWCDPPETKQEHKSGCKKCSYETQRDQLSIQVHEWPLPADLPWARAIVFELRVPDWYGHWRDSRAFLLHEALHGYSKQLSPKTTYLLSSNDPHLTTRHYRHASSQRITLLSQTKPCVNTHYRCKGIANLTESEICQPSGLQYGYYDTKTSTDMGPLKFKDTVSRDCTYKLARAALQKFVFRPATAPDGPGPNLVIASQDECPPDLSLDEHKELTTIPLGHNIQWANILAQLAMPGVDFKKLDTSLVILQCIYQTGPSRKKTVTRESHSFLNNNENVDSLVKNLGIALQRVKENWESAQALRVFIAIAARTLSLSDSLHSTEQCLSFLKTARHVALKWLLDLREKAYYAEDHEQRTLFVQKGVEVALICASTFDVDEQYLYAALQENGSILLRCSIIVQEGEHSWASSSSKQATLLNFRYKRLLWRAYKTLAGQQLHKELDVAITNAWSGFVSGSSGWRTVSESTDHWLTMDSAATSDSSSMTVHFDLLSGTLLVNGLPLDQPPKNYRISPLYTDLFRSSAVEVMPCTSAGFQFSAKRGFGGGYEVQLGMAEGQLVVKARKASKIYETIPARVITDFPLHFTRDYVHWLDIVQGLVQFRPKEDPWDNSAAAIWTLARIPRQQKWQLSKGQCAVAGVESSTSRHISKILAPLADTATIHNIVRLGKSPGELQVEIPHLHTGFIMAAQSSAMESREYRGMFIDSDQTIGTLVGFSSKVVLTTANIDTPYSRSRMVLIPASSSITLSRESQHVRVVASKSDMSTLHSLAIDAELGRLVDNGDITCKLYLAYLHALTSFVLVDPLTKKSGTEQGLTIMRGAAVHSFGRLSADHLRILKLLADLSSGRTFYPQNLRVMQTVGWHQGLSALSQHGHFALAADELLQRALKAAVFTPEAQADLQRCKLPMPERHLLERDNIRSAAFRVSRFGAEDYTTRHDVAYQARDRNTQSQATNNAAEMSRFVFRDGHDRMTTAVSQTQLWEASRTVAQLEGPGALAKAKSLTKYRAGAISAGHADVLRSLTALHRWLGSSDSRAHKFSIMMWLSTIASAAELDSRILQMVAMMFKAPSLGNISAPALPVFTPKLGSVCNVQDLQTIARSNRKQIESCPEHTTTRYVNERLAEYTSRKQGLWQHSSDSVIAAFVDAISRQWPCEEPSIPNVSRQDTYINVSVAMNAISKKFKVWHDNKRLRDYFAELETAMGRIGLTSLPALNSSRNVQPAFAWHACSAFVSENDLFLSPAPRLPPGPDAIQAPCGQRKEFQSAQQPLLASLVTKLRSSASLSRFAEKYVADLENSLKALRHGEDASPVETTSETELVTNFRRCENHVRQVYARLVAALEVSRSAIPHIHLPRISPTGFLQQMSRDRWHQLSSDWQACIVSYGLALTALQRSVRLLKLSAPSRADDLLIELRNPGHTNWDPVAHPESLLIEVESGIMIREVQEQIAEHMRAPPDGENAVMQLLMGQGKSSVIVPIVSVHLAGKAGDTLCRVLVAKPQSKQMQSMLISKVSGLVGRRVYYMPFSRSLKLDVASASIVCDLLRECRDNGGILLVQPEHILSFQLMALECMVTGKEAVARQLLAPDIRSMLASSRDIVDESDENFSVHFELIYTMGTQTSIELSPDRWILAQQILDVVRLLAPQLAEELPDSFEYLPGACLGSFSRFRILRKDGEDLLLNRLAEHVCKHGLYGLQISRQPEPIRRAIIQYIRTLELNNTERSAVETSSFWTESTSSPLLLLRGFLAGGVLAFVFGQKRWRVNYGLTTTRTPPTSLCVPYRAKDSPSPRSEYSHPDVVLFLTSLSYYYGGLDDEAMLTTLSHVVDSDQSDIEYQAWVADSPTLPIAFRQLQGINLRDQLQCIREIFPHLRYAKSVVDYFLSHIVFPKEMKQFPLKLSASGWDMGKSKKVAGGAVTGFSGTNDSRILLPVDVVNLDLPEQRHTNALVLEHILQPENGVVLISQAQDATLSDAERLLNLVVNLDPPVQVILDVGAQILEMNNLQVSKTWLSLSQQDPSFEAAVYVNEDDEICVVNRAGRIEALKTSSYANRLGSCLVFLDQSHTRGIDLQLPKTYRAALTLGAGLIKDNLTQAAMRMRRLGRGQTLVFCVPHEIRTKICEVTSKPDTADITIEDILHWSIWETQKEIRRSMPLWATQGERFCRQDALWQEQTVITRAHAEKFQEEEAQSIQQRQPPGFS